MNITTVKGLLNDIRTKAENRQPIETECRDILDWCKKSRDTANTVTIDLNTELQGKISSLSNDLNKLTLEKETVLKKHKRLRKRIKEAKRKGKDPLVFNFNLLSLNKVLEASLAVEMKTECSTTRIRANPILVLKYLMLTLLYDCFEFAVEPSERIGIKQRLKKGLNRIIAVYRGLNRANALTVEGDDTLLTFLRQRLAKRNHKLGIGHTACLSDSSNWDTVFANSVLIEQESGG